MQMHKIGLVLCTLMAVAIIGTSNRTLADETLEGNADLWGRMHGAAIYCRLDSAHDFGVQVVKYFQQRAGSSARLESLKQTYGTNLIVFARKSPSGKIGNGCGPFRKKYEQVYKMLKG